MARKTNPSDMDHAVQLYLTGKTIKQAAAEAGVTTSPLHRELRRRRIETSRCPAWLSLPAEEVISRYVNGVSEYALAECYGVQRKSIRQLMEHHNITVRDMSAASQARYANTTPEQRSKQTAAAHAANLGRKATWEERCKYAATRERQKPELSIHEATFSAWLSERDVPYRREVAIGAYNIDFAIGSVAVEILGGEWHAYKARHIKRTPYILNHGWALAFVWSTENCPMTAASTDYVITFANEVTRNPSLIGEYRVVRGDGHLITFGRGDDNQFSGIEPARQGLNSIC